MKSLSVTGTPSTLHLWWARRPLATARAVLFASIVDDSSEHPELFPTDEAQDAERKRLFKLIEELVKWESSGNTQVLAQARDKLKRYGGDLPAVFDPFAGGGSIPLEAQRLGLKALAADLNPVAAMNSASQFCADVFTQSGFNDISFGEADVLARAKNISAGNLEEMGAIISERGRVRLRDRNEMPVLDEAKQLNRDWVKKLAASDCVWLWVQNAIEVFDKNGFSGCGEFLTHFEG